MDVDAIIIAETGCKAHWDIYLLQMPMKARRIWVPLLFRRHVTKVNTKHCSKWKRISNTFIINMFLMS